MLSKGGAAHARAAPPPAGHAAADEHRGGSCALDELAGGGELEGEASPSESMGGPPDMGVYDSYFPLTARATHSRRPRGTRGAYVGYGSVAARTTTSFRDRNVESIHRTHVLSINKFK